MILSRELGKRIWGGSTNIENGGGGVSGDYIAGLLTGYAKESWVDEHYISIDFFSRLFQAHGTENGSEIDVMPNDMDTTITSVESMFGFWTNLYISALGSNGAAPAGISLGMLTDVVISGTPSAGQVLTFDAVTQKWVNANAQAGATALANLTDVTLTSLQTNQILIYDANTQKWVNSSVKTINGYSIFGTGDIPASGGGGGNYLPLAGGTMTGDINFHNSTSNTTIFRLHDYLNTFQISGTDNGAYFNSAIFRTTFHSFLFRENPTRSVEIHPGKVCCVGDATTGWGVGISFKYNNGGLEKMIAGALGQASSSFNWYFYGGDYNDATIYITGAQWSAGGRVGIGVSSPLNTLHVNGETRSKGYFGTETDTSYASSRMWGIYQWDNNLSFTYRDLNNSYLGDAMAINLSSGYVCIGGRNANYPLQVIGTIYATGSITALSDARKKDITGEAGVTVEQIAHAPAVQFLWKDKERRKDGQQVGTLAQYWRTVLPEVVMDKGGELSMQYGVAALVSAIITARKVVDHERRITELEKENERLQKEVEQLRLN